MNHCVRYTGERLDFVDHSWVNTAPRPYDPPLTKRGEEQAKKNAKDLMGKVRVGFVASNQG